MKINGVNLFKYIVRLRRISPYQAFLDEAVYPTGKSRQLVCHRFSTYGSRPLSRTPKADWEHVCFGMSVHRTSLLQFSLPALGLFFRIQVQAPTATLARHIRDQRSVWKLTFNSSSFFWELFDRMMVSGCQCPPCSKISSCPVPRLWHAGVKPIKATTTEASF